MYASAASVKREDLSRRERATRVVLCCSRAAQAGGRLVVDL